MSGVKLPLYLGMEVWEELEKKGIQRRFDSMGMLSFEFSQEELDSIEKLKIHNPVAHSVKGISNLRNLKVLALDRDYPKIKGFRLKSGVYMPQEEFTHSRDISSIGDEQAREIEKLERLESLTMVGQSKVTSFDVSKMKSLKHLNISGNMRLETIDGLEKLQELESLTLIGNHQLRSADGLNKCLNNETIESVKLNPQLFPTAIAFDTRTHEEDTGLIEKMKAGDIDISFFERYTSLNDIKMSIQHMLTAHEKAKEIVKSIAELKPNIREKIILSQAYLGDKVVYDGRAMEGDHTHMEGNRAVGLWHGANGMYNCLVLNECVCEGYTRGAKYLLELQGIHSREVSCVLSKDSGLMRANDDPGATINLPADGYHSVLLVDDIETGELGYCDPCANAAYYKAKRTLPYMLMGKEEMKETHTLSLEESAENFEVGAFQRETINKQTEAAIYKYNQHKQRKFKKEVVKRTTEEVRLGEISGAARTVRDEARSVVYEQQQDQSIGR